MQAAFTFGCLTHSSTMAMASLPSASQIFHTTTSSSAATKCPTQHITGHFGNNFYRPDDQTNSVKTLKETSWSTRSGLNPTRTTPPCYNNTTLGNRFYAQCQGPNVTNPNLSLFNVLPNYSQHKINSMLQQARNVNM